MRPKLFLVLATAAGCALAQQYRWIDDKGRVQYTDTPPPASAKGVQRKDFGSKPGGAPESAQSSALAAAVKSHPIRLYTIEDCAVGCAEARNHLNKRGVPFTEVRVSDEKSRRELIKISGGTYVPVIWVGRRVHMGFGAEDYDNILDVAGYPGGPAAGAK